MSVSFVVNAMSTRRASWGGQILADCGLLKTLLALDSIGTTWLQKFGGRLNIEGHCYFILQAHHASGRAQKITKEAETSGR